MAVFTNDLIAAKLKARYPLPAIQRDVTELLNRYRADQGLEGYEEYVAHVAAASASLDFNDDLFAFWTAFVP